MNKKENLNNTILRFSKWINIYENLFIDISKRSSYYDSTLLDISYAMTDARAFLVEYENFDYSFIVKQVKRLSDLVYLKFNEKIPDECIDFNTFSRNFKINEILSEK